MYAPHFGAVHAVAPHSPPPVLRFSRAAKVRYGRSLDATNHACSSKPSRQPSWPHGSSRRSGTTATPHPPRRHDRRLSPDCRTLSIWPTFDRYLRAAPTPWMQCFALSPPSQSLRTVCLVTRSKHGAGLRRQQRRVGSRSTHSGRRRTRSVEDDYSFGASESGRRRLNASAVWSSASRASFELNRRSDIWPRKFIRRKTRSSYVNGQMR